LSDNSQVERIRNLFVVGCYTGLRLPDLTQLNIESTNREKKVIKVNTQKTQELVIIPFKGMVQTIIEKYEGKLPNSIASQRMNYALKAIRERAAINETFERVATKGGKRVREVFKKYEMITVHTARRSFATKAYLQNVPSISIMKAPGHRTDRNFLKYIKISQEDNANKHIHHPFFS
jgi:integrase